MDPEAIFKSKFNKLFPPLRKPAGDMRGAAKSAATAYTKTLTAIVDRLEKVVAQRRLAKQADLRKVAANTDSAKAKVVVIGAVIEDLQMRIGLLEKQRAAFNPSRSVLQ